MTIEESMLKKSNSLVKNVVEIDSLGEDIEKISLKDSPAQEDEDKSKDNTKSKILKWSQLNHFQKIRDMLQAIPRTSCNSPTISNILNNHNHSFKPSDYHNQL